MSREMQMAREWLENFVAGGSLVLLALFIAYASSPVLGGIIAAIPIKFGITFVLGGIREGEEFAANMARGSILGMTANLLFSLTLFLSLLSLADFYVSFGAATAVCLAAVILLRLTFPE